MNFRGTAPHHFLSIGGLIERVAFARVRSFGDFGLHFAGRPKPLRLSLRRRQIEPESRDIVLLAAQFVAAVEREYGDADESEAYRQPAAKHRHVDVTRAGHHDQRDADSGETETQHGRNDRNLILQTEFALLLTASRVAGEHDAPRAVEAEQRIAAALQITFVQFPNDGGPARPADADVVGERQHGHPAGVGHLNVNAAVEAVRFLAQIGQQQFLASRKTVAFARRDVARVAVADRPRVAARRWIGVGRLSQPLEPTNHRHRERGGGGAPQARVKRHRSPPVAC